MPRTSTRRWTICGRSHSRGSTDTGRLRGTLQFALISRRCRHRRSSARKPFTPPAKQPAPFAVTPSPARATGDVQRRHSSSGSDERPGGYRAGPLAPATASKSSPPGRSTQVSCSVGASNADGWDLIADTADYPMLGNDSRRYALIGSIGESGSWFPGRAALPAPPLPLRGTDAALLGGEHRHPARRVGDIQHTHIVNGWPCSFGPD